MPEVFGMLIRYNFSIRDFTLEKRPGYANTNVFERRTTGSSDFLSSATNTHFNLDLYSEYDLFFITVSFPTT